ncbi:MAG: putative toxin-antitoxin system toxin component, PIN family [Sphingorhabdus sp.]
MRLVVDTNIWISALLASDSLPDRLLELINDRKLILLTSEAQFGEYRRVTHYSKLRSRINKRHAGRLLNDFRKVGVNVDPLPHVDRSPDSFDNFLLAMAEAGRADFLITGDKADLLAFKTHGQPQIVTARQFLEIVL